MEGREGAGARAGAGSERRATAPRLIGSPCSARRRVIQYLGEEDTADLVREIASTCHDKVKAFMGGQPRYKLIFEVTVGENNGQMCRTVSRSLWNPQYDCSIDATWSNGRIYAVVMCFALYHD